MKRLLAVLLIACMTLCLFACGSDSDDDDDDSTKKRPKETETASQAIQYDEHNLPLTLKCKVSGEWSIDDYDTLQYWRIVYFENRKYSHDDVYILFATTEEAVLYADREGGEICGNGYFVKRTSNDGWRNYSRKDVVSNITNYPMAVIEMEDGENIPFDRFDEIKDEYNLP